MSSMVQVILSFCLISLIVSLQETRFKKYPLLEDKNITAGHISNYVEITSIGCGISCLNIQSCESFIFNTETGECQYHDAIFTTAAEATDQIGLQYFYIVKGSNDWCPTELGFQLLTLDGPCVKFHNDTKNWTEAYQTCASYSKHSRLLVLDSTEKQGLVKAAGEVIDDQFSSALWIGLKIDPIKNIYTWVDGTDLNFTDWSGKDKGGDCVYMQRSRSWQWTKNYCATEQHYVCELEMDIDLYHKMMDIKQ